MLAVTTNYIASRDKIPNPDLYESICEWITQAVGFYDPENWAFKVDSDGTYMQPTCDRTLPPFKFSTGVWRLDIRPLVKDIYDPKSLRVYASKTLSVAFRVALCSGKSEKVVRDLAKSLDVQLTIQRK